MVKTGQSWSKQSTLDKFWSKLVKQKGLNYKYGYFWMSLQFWTIKSENGLFRKLMQILFGKKFSDIFK